MTNNKEALARANRGAVLRGRGRHVEALAEFHQAARLAPSLPEAHYNLGTVFTDLGRLVEAEASYRRALQLRPAYAEALNNLAALFMGQGRNAEALPLLQRLIEKAPTSPVAHYNLASVYGSLEQLAESEASYRRALDLKPDLPEAHGMLGNLYSALGRYEEAVASFRRLIDLRPTSPDGYYNLGNTFGEQGRYEEAVPWYRKALAFAPAFAKAHVNLAMVLLRQGDFEGGWAEYEWRLRLPRWLSTAPAFAQPCWQGESLAGRTILLHAEQGLGDTLQFIRLAPGVKERGGTVLLFCPAELAGLLRACAGIDRIVTASSALPAFDVQAPLLSLPAILKSTLATVPAAVPYLAADAAAVERWRRELSSYPEYKVGIIWQGNPRFSDAECRSADRRRSIPLSQFEPVARVPGVRLFSLQKGYGTEQLAERRGQETLAERWGVVALGDRLSDFTDTAAVMKNLDLIISADTSPLHLAGALGMPVWAALPSAACWRWLLEREDTPWYPTMRLFRQSRPGNWANVFDRMARELNAKVRG